MAITKQTVKVPMAGVEPGLQGPNLKNLEIIQATSAQTSSEETRQTLVSPETDRVRPTGNRRKLKQILHVAYVCESGHSPDLGPRSTDVSRGNHRRSTTSRNPKSCRYRGSNPGHTAYADALYQLDYVALS